VAGVVAAVVGIENFSPPPASEPAAPAPSHGVGQSTVTQPSPSAADIHLPNAASLAPSKLRGVRVLDLSFAGADDGWALASADCVRGAGRCTALLRTTDGSSWRSMPGAAFNVSGVKGCAYPCVAHLRFADDRVGYAYGSSAFLMTIDGGATWQRQPGGAEFLETLDGNVVRVVSDGSGCPGPCNVGVQTAPIGSSRWTTAHLAQNPVSGAGLAFARGGSDAYLLVKRNPAGGAVNQTSTLYRSSNDGHAWQASGEPCPQSGAEVDSIALAAAAAGRVSVLCTTRQAPSRRFVATSGDHGRTFSARPGTVAAAAADQLAGDPATVLLAAGDGLVRSADGGRSWQAVVRPSGVIGFVGFESAQVGRVVADGGRSIWTTRDAGRSWHRFAPG
jgi:photosystem II stability/assembly factor-like uncharacterized protein